MTLQHLYEKLVVRTFDNARYASTKNPYYAFANTLNGDEPFSEICLKADLIGLNIPEKADFKRFGEKYLINCLMFIIVELKDTDFLDEFLDTITSHSSTLGIITDEFKNACYDCYFDSITTDKYIAQSLGTFIIKNCTKSDFYKKFWPLANAFGTFDASISYSDFIATRPKDVV